MVAGKCTTRAPLTLFTDSAFGPDAQLRIPAYLCGSPKFVVVKVDSSALTIEKGAVLVENETDTVLPNNLYKCFDPIIGSALEFVDSRWNKDPQYQDVVVWQSTNPINMLENAATLPTYTGNPDYVGAATEATNGCGSTVAKVRGASYFVVGMHIDFGTGFDYEANPALNYTKFVELTRYKLTLLRKSIVAARTTGSLEAGGLDGDGRADLARDLQARPGQSCGGIDPGQAVPLARQCGNVYAKTRCKLQRRPPDAR